MGDAIPFPQQAATGLQRRRGSPLGARGDAVKPRKNSRGEAASGALLDLEGEEAAQQDLAHASRGWRRENLAPEAEEARTVHRRDRRHARFARSSCRHCRAAFAV